MRNTFIILLLAIFMSSCDQPEMLHEDDRIMKFSELEEKFADPPLSYRTVPFWVWNGKMTREIIDEQLADYKDKGFGGVFVHPRYGLINEYLSSEWFELVDYSAQKAEELDLYLWLYDENSFPSGFAGGHVPAEMPESWNQGVGMELHKSEVFDPDTSRDWIAFYRLQEGNWVTVGENPEELRGEKGQFALIEKTYFNRSKFFAGFNYVDLLVDGVTEKFIELTMSGYEEILGDEFGKRVPGVFTDEPNISPRSRNNARYTPGLFEAFLDEWGYSLKDNLVSLFEETGDWRKVRHNYYSLLLNLFIEKWSEPWYAYTEANNLDWTGHYWEHGWPNPYHGGDNMAMYAYHQVPGIDMLFNSMTDRPDQFGNVRAVKELSSIANQFMRHRTLSETYGASGYEIDFASLKRNGDWQYALGVNLMNQHLSYQTTLGDRKHDFPQTFSYHTRWWDEYREHADYFARLSLALSSGYQLNEILVIEPTTTAWMYHSPVNESQTGTEVGEPFTRFINQLELYKIQYDLASEKTMRDFGSSADGKIEISHREYSILLLPPGLENLDDSSFDLIRDFLSSGGTLISFNGVPGYINGDTSDDCQTLFEKHSDQVRVFEDAGNLSSLQELLDPEIQFTGKSADSEHVYWMRRQFSDGDLLFFANFDRARPKSFDLRLPTHRSIVELDPISGQFYEPQEYKTENGIDLKVRLSDAGSRLFFVSKEKLQTKTRKQPVLEGGKVVNAVVSETRRLEPNVIVLDYCRLIEPAEISSGPEYEYYYKVHDRIYQAHGFPDNPWVSSVQYKTEIIDRDTFSMGSGFKVEYPLRVLKDVNTDGIELAVERPHLYTIEVNGKKVETDPARWYTDKGMKRARVGEYLQEGKNTITLTGRPFSVHHELAPVFLLGNFGVFPAEKGWVIGPESPITRGSWKQYGMPFYPGEVRYTKIFTRDTSAQAYYLEAGKWNGAAATVSVNNSEEMLLWPPYKMDITDYLKPGENRVSLKITGSLKSLYGPHHNVQREGIVTPWSFKYAPETLPPGKEYDLPSYGVMTDFTILSY